MMNLDSKIYVAGHRGLVGSAILRKLKAEGYKNLVTRSHHELDLIRQDEVEAFFESERPKYVFLAAAKVGGILANSTYPAEFIYNNIMVQSNVIHNAYRVAVKKLLFLGSSCIYPRECPQPMKEEYLLSGKLEATNEPYAIAKIAAIKMCRYFNEQFKTDFISVMPTNLYGPGDNFNLETAHVLPALIRKFHLAMLLQKSDLTAIKKDLTRYLLGFGLDEKTDVNDRRSVEDALHSVGVTKRGVTIWGTGEVYREFLYVDDLAEACVFLMERYGYKEIGELINIGTGRDVQLKELTELIKGIVGFSGTIERDRSRHYSHESER